MARRMHGGVNRKVFDDAKKIHRSAFRNAFNTTSLGAFPLLTYTLSGEGNDVEEYFAVLGGTDVPKHKGQVHYTQPTWYSFDVQSDPHAKGVRFTRDDFQADKLGFFSEFGSSLGRHLQTTKRKRSVEYLVKGFTSELGTTYDGQTLFDTAHVTADGKLWSNSHALPLTAENFNIVYASLVSAPMPDGDQLFEVYDGQIEVSLIVGPSNLAAAEAIVQPILASGASNPNAKKVSKIVTLSDLREDGDFDAYSDYWFMQASTVAAGEMKPLTFLEFEAPETEYLWDGDEAFDSDVYKVKVRGDHGFGYRAPWAIQGSTGAP